MTLNEIVITITEELGVPNDFATQQKFKDIVIGQRATFIYRNYERTGSFSESLIQTLGNVVIERFDRGLEHGKIALETFVNRTKNTIPQLLRVRDSRNVALPFVGSIDSRIAYGHMNYGRAESLPEHGKPMYALRDGRIYIFRSVAKYIMIRGVFDDPRDASVFPDASGIPCYDDDMEFPMPQDMRDLIITNIIREKKPLDNVKEEEIKTDAERS